MEFQHEGKLTPLDEGCPVAGGHSDVRLPRLRCVRCDSWPALPDLRRGSALSAGPGLRHQHDGCASRSHRPGMHAGPAKCPAVAGNDGRTQGRSPAPFLPVSAVSVGERKPPGDARCGRGLSRFHASSKHTRTVPRSESLGDGEAIHAIRRCERKCTDNSDAARRSATIRPCRKGRRLPPS